MYKIGLSTRNKVFGEELFAKYQNGGMKYMEVALTCAEYDALDFDWLRTVCAKYGVRIWTFHLPYSPFSRVDLSSPALADDTVRYYGEIIKKGTALGVYKYVVHPSGEPVDEDAEGRAVRMETAKRSLSALAEIADEYGAVIAVEDLPRSCLGRNAEEMHELLSAHPLLCVCVDTNHLLTENPADFIRAFGDKVVTLHLSDYDQMNERHWISGEGIIDWQDILSALKEIDYDGIWLYEVGFECPKTIYRDRELTCEDFIINAKEIFEGKKPSIISRPKPNLGMWE